jgi:hypothetical protein
MKITLLKTRGKVVVEYNMTERYKVNVVVKCEALLVILFNVVLDYILKKLDFWVNINISTKMVQIDAYADNVVIRRNLLPLKNHYRN